MELKDLKKPKLYSAMEVAAQMGISYNALWRLVFKGKIKAINIAASGKKQRLRFRAEDIQAYYDKLPDSAARVENKHE